MKQQPFATKVNMVNATFFQKIQLNIHFIWFVRFVLSYTKQNTMKCLEGLQNES